MTFVTFQTRPAFLHFSPSPGLCVSVSGSSAHLEFSLQISLVLCLCSARCSARFVIDIRSEIHGTWVGIDLANILIHVGVVQ